MYLDSYIIDKYLLLKYFRIIIIKATVLDWKELRKSAAK